jgi:hypothetical protein
MSKHVSKKTIMSLLKREKSLGNAKNNLCKVGLEAENVK